MALGDSSVSISGGWIGAYYYDSRLRPPVRFEASFIRLRGVEEAVELEMERFGGTILDDENGHGSSIITNGVQQSSFVRFVKVHTPPAPGLFPVQYVGTLSADGKHITGHWKISLAAHRRARAREITGTWEARRLWHADTEDNLGTEDAVQELRELHDR